MVHTICKAKKEGIEQGIDQGEKNKAIEVYSIIPNMISKEEKENLEKANITGYIDLMNDEPLEVCQQCADWVDGEQCYKDWQEVLKKEIGGIK